MIAVLFYSLLFLFALICTFISPTTKEFLSLRSQSSRHSAAAAEAETVCSVSRRSEAAVAAAVESDCSSSSSRRAELKSVFATFDKNDDGHITKQELRESLRNIGIAAGEGDVEDMVRKVDANGDGLIDFDEFCRLFGGASGAVEELDACDGDGGLKEAFDVFDGNKDGLITVEELGLVLSSLGFTEGKKLDDCREMIMKVDMDGDGMVNFDEFKKMMKSGFGRLIQVS